MKISEYIRNHLRPELQSLPEIVISMEAVCAYEEEFGTAATLKLVESTILDEIKDQGEDQPHVKFLVQMLSDVKKLHGSMSN